MVKLLRIGFTDVGWQVRIHPLNCLRLKVKGSLKKLGSRALTELEDPSTNLSR